MNSNTWLLERMALGYIKNYRCLEISKHHTWTDITNREIDYFERLGELLGYYSMREYKQADLVWKNPDYFKIKLYLERETNNDKIPKTIQKLKAPNFKDDECLSDLIRVGVFGWSTQENLKLIRYVAKEMSLTLFVTWVGPNKNDVDSVYLFVNGGCSFAEFECDGKLEDEYWKIIKRNRKKDDGIVMGRVCREIIKGSQSIFNLTRIIEKACDELGLTHDWRNTGTIWCYTNQIIDNNIYAIYLFESSKLFFSRYIVEGNIPQRLDTTFEGWDNHYGICFDLNDDFFNKSLEGQVKCIKEFIQNFRQIAF